MVSRIYLVRHGETDGAEVRRYKGSIDVPLSEAGIEQIRRVSVRISEQVRKQGGAGGPTEHRGSPTPSLAAVYCSDLIRAVRSAEIVAEPHGMSPEVVPGLRERSFGLWEGMSFDEIRERYPVEFNAWAENPLKFSPMGGESTLEVWERVMQALDGIMGKHSGGSVALVAHGGVNRVIMCHFLGVPLENMFRIEQDYGALNIIDLHEGYPVVKLLNGGPCE
jgi:alpha-ribazole phosphatase